MPKSLMKKETIDGALRQGSPDLSHYFWLSLTRAMDLKAKSLHSQGKLCTFPSSRGQESWFVGLGATLAVEDIYLPYYRDHGCLLQRGYTPADIFSYWAGFESANQSGYTQDFSFSVPIASQTTHAVGAAWRYKNTRDRLVICSLGDGATSKGDFYEALNFACIYALPVLFVINHNNLAISTSFDKQSATPLATKFQGFACHVNEVSGLDFDAACAAISFSLSQLRIEKRPGILIAHTARLDPHTVLDDYEKYADPQDIRALRLAHDPVVHYQNSLLDKGLASDQDFSEIDARTKDLIDQAAEICNNHQSTQKNPAEFLFAHH